MMIQTIQGVRERSTRFCRDRDWEKFHLPTSIALALAGETGEVCEIYQWKRFLEHANPSERDQFSTKEIINIGEEIADVFIYSTRLCEMCNIDLAHSIQEKMNILQSVEQTLGASPSLVRSKGDNTWTSLELDDIVSCAREYLFPQFRSPRHVALSLQAEVGKLCALFQSKSESISSRGLPGWSTKEVNRLGNSLGTICLLLACLTLFHNHSLGKCITDKFAKNEAKYPADLVRGKSAKYTAYSAEVAARQSRVDQGVVNKGDNVGASSLPSVFFDHWDVFATIAATFAILGYLIGASSSAGLHFI